MDPPWGDVHPLSPPPYILPNPQKGATLTRAPRERDAPFPEPSNYLLKYSVNGLHRFPNGPLWRVEPVSRMVF